MIVAASDEDADKTIAALRALTLLGALVAAAVGASAVWFLM